jgi:hypothetical protein
MGAHSCTYMETVSDLDLLLAQMIHRFRLTNEALAMFRKPNDRTGMYFIDGGEHNLNDIYEQNAELLQAVELEIFDRQVNEAPIS